VPTHSKRRLEMTEATTRRRIAPIGHRKRASRRTNASNPFSDARLSLKQVDVSTLGDIERFVFSATLGTYGFEHRAHEIAEAKKSLSQLLAGTEVQFDSSQARRFAGDRTLPRTRYFSILDRGGSDGRTLLREMSAYFAGSSYPGLVSLFDTDGTNTLELLGILAAIPKRNYQALNLTIPSLLIAIRPLTTDHVLADAYGTSSQYVVQVPYRLSDRRVTGVLDLREPKARRWLIDQFNGKVHIGRKRSPVMIGRKRVAGFGRLLPSLLDQWLGGGWTTANLTGIFARQAGASGLVYPSARSNAWVELRDNMVTDFSGWCFVSYEGAPKMEIGTGVSIASDEWPTRIGWSPHNEGWMREFIPLKNVEISYVRRGTRAGSFVIRGLTEYTWATFRLSQVTAVLRGLDAKLGQNVSSRLTYMSLYSAAEDIERIAGILYGALLGDGQAIADLKMAITKAGSDYERDTLAEVQRVIALVPRGFRAKGALAEAIGFS
jgi:hypothetical protein